MVDSCVSISRMAWASGAKGYVRGVLVSTIVGIARGGCCD